MRSRLRADLGLATGGLHSDRSAILLVTTARTGLVCALLTALFDADPAIVIPLVIGALLVGAADPAGSFGLRLRAMGLGTLLVTCATLVGLLVAGVPLLHLAAAPLVAAFCGYIGIGGPRAGLAGMIALVTFSVFAGSPGALGEIVPATLLVLAGGLIQMAVALLPELLGTMEAARTDLVVAWRALALGIPVHAGRQGILDAATRVGAAGDRVRAAGASGATRAWLETLATGAEQVWLAAVALGSGIAAQPAAATGPAGGAGGAAGAAAATDAERAAVTRILAAAARTAGAIGWGLQLGILRRRVPGALAHFDAELAAARPALSPARAADAAALDAALRSAAVATGGAWPTGRRAERSLAAGFVHDPLRLLVTLPDRGGRLRGHALRLACTYTIATAIAIALAVPHAYWIPMTVAWLMKPDLSLTIPRLVSRIVGTLAGVAIATSALLLVPGIGTSVALVGLSATLVYAFLMANYAVATAGVTICVLALFELLRLPLDELTGVRIASTLLASGLVAVVTFAWRPVHRESLAADLAAQARALAAYAGAVRSGATAEALEAARRALVAARLAVAAEIGALAWEGGRHPLPAVLGQSLCRDLIAASVTTLEAELGPGDPADVVPEPALAALDHLGDRLAADLARVPGRPDGAGSADAFSAPLARAHARLDAHTHAHGG